MQKNTLIVALILLTAPWIPLLPSAAAQEGDNCTQDAPGDTVLYSPGVPQTTAYIPRTEGSELTNDPIGVFPMADLTSVCIGEETERTFTVRLSVTELNRAANTRSVGSSLDLSVCFTYTGDGQLYRIWTRISYGNDALTDNPPELHHVALQLVDECRIQYTEGQEVQKMIRGMANRGNFAVTFQDNTVVIQTDRDAFANIGLKDGSGKYGEYGVPPTSGDALRDVSAHTQMWASNQFALIAGDQADANDMEFLIGSCTGPINLEVVSNVHRSYLQDQGSASVPAYGVHVGSYQTVPVVIYNHASEAIQVNLSVDLKEGAAADWDVRIIPSIPIAASSNGQPGNTTVTLIINAAPTIQHKDHARIELMAKVHGGDGCAKALVDLAGVVPPDVDRPTIYFHAQGQPCAGGSWWMNTLQTDPLGTAEELPHSRSCDDGSGLGREAPFRFWQDVEPARHYTLDASQQATAKVAFKSSMGTPSLAGDPQEVIIPAVADVVAEIFSGPVPIGRGVRENVQIGDGTDSFDIEIDIYPENRLVSTRYVPNEEPLNVFFTVTVRDRDVTFGSALVGGERTVNVLSPSGVIHMILPSSSITIPIIESERAGDIINVTKSGALVSLRANTDKTAFMNPEKTKVFNITVRNEGLNPDTIELKATLNKTGWLANIQPKTVFRLGVGLAETFEVLIKVPQEAREEESVRMDLMAVSRVDPEATARMTLVVKATKGTIFQDEAPEFSQSAGVVEVKEKTPSIGLATGLTLLAAASISGRRRRRTG